jgi:DNA primase
MQLYDLPGWAAGSAAVMYGMDLPNDVQNIVVLVDNDIAGERSSIHAAQRWVNEGRRVSVANPPIGKDFNDTLIAEASR